VGGTGDFDVLGHVSLRSLRPGRPTMRRRSLLALPLRDHGLRFPMLHRRLDLSAATRRMHPQRSLHLRLTKTKLTWGLGNQPSLSG